MINIYKLIKSVKNGSLSFSPFNLRVKKAEGFNDDDWSDEAIEWRTQQKSQNVSVSDPASSTIPSGTQVSHPINQIPSDAITEDEADVFYSWCLNVRPEIESEAEYPIEVLKEKSPKESPIQAAPGIYHIINKNPKLHQNLVNMIMETTKVNDENKANIFVDTVVAKSKSLEVDIGERSYQEKADAEINRREKALEDKKIRDSDLAKERDAYSVADPLPQPALDQIFDKKWLDSTEEEKANVYGLIGDFRKDTTQPFQASNYRFGDQSKRVVDQRMNFFLSYPQHLQNVMDERLVSVLKTEMPKQGLSVGYGSPSDIMDGLKGMRGENVEAGSKGRILNILNNEKGTELYGVLSNLILSGSTDIYRWLEPRIKNPYGEDGNGSYDAGSEGDNSGPGNAGIKENTDVKKKQIPKADIFEEYEGSQILGIIGTEYLSPTLKKSKGVMTGAIGDMFSSAKQEYNNAQTSKEKKAALENFSIAEIINAFNLPIIGHLESLFSEQGKKRGEGTDKLRTLYKNKNGRIEIPFGVGEDILKRIKEEDDIPGFPHPGRHDYEGLVKRYIMRIENGTAEPYSPNWHGLITHHYPVNTFKAMGKLKEQIRDYAKNKINPGDNTIDKIIVAFDRPLEEKSKDGQKKQMHTLSEFAGAKIGDSQSTKRKKMEDYVYMTLSQPEFDSKWLQTLGSRKDGNSNKKNNNQHYHNIKSYIGDNYHKFLGYLANKKDIADNIVELDALVNSASYDGHDITPEEIAKMNTADGYTPEDLKESKGYTDEAMGVIIGLLDHHGDIRNFLKNGSAVNRVDNKNRTNTELYYSLRGVDPPDHIKALYEIMGAGLSQSNQVNSKTMQPKLELGSWFHNFFREYEKFDPVIRGFDRAKDALDIVEEKEDAHYRHYNNSLLKALNHPKNKIPDSAYRARLKKIKDSVERNRVDSIVQEWRRDPTERLDPEIYIALSFLKFNSDIYQKTVVDRKDQIQNGYTSDKKRYVPGIKDLELKSVEIKNNLKEMIDSHSGELSQIGIDTDSLLPRLRLAKEEYDRVLIKIANLERMKKNSIKIASSESIGYIDVQIARIKTEFDNYFNSLFL